MGNYGVLNKPDKRINVKVSDKNMEGLKRFQQLMLEKHGLKVSLPLIANTAIETGLPEMEKKS